MPTTEIYFQTTYNRELIFDVTLGAFSIYEMDHSTTTFPRIHDYLELSGYTVGTEQANVVDNNGVIVTDGSGNPVTVDAIVSAARTTDPREERFKFLVTKSNKWTLAEYKDYSFYDWVTVNTVGESYDSYLITGYNLAGDMARHKQAIYLQIFCKRTEEAYTLVGNTIGLNRQSSCMVQAQWDWCDSNAQGKWGTAFQTYRMFKKLPASPSVGDVLDYGDTVIVTKNKLRGRGKALSLYIYSEAGKDLKLLGWNLLINVNGEP